MASVWRGHDRVLDRAVAVKVLSDAIASDPSFQARFRREATVAAALSHPNLVRVFDYAEADERPYLVMELVPGDDLGQLIAHGEAVDRGRLARQLLAALAHIHGAGIVHRDVKPGNVLIEADGNAKLIDFGIALPPDATALTSTGLILGTKSFAAPEVMRGEPAGVRSDLYSCGLVLAACEGVMTPGPRGAGRRPDRGGPRGAAAFGGGGAARARGGGRRAVADRLEETVAFALEPETEPTRVDAPATRGRAALGRRARAARRHRRGRDRRGDFPRRRRELGAQFAAGRAETRGDWAERDAESGDRASAEAAESAGSRGSKAEAGNRKAAP